MHKFVFIISVHSQADIEFFLFSIICRGTRTFERTCLCCTHARICGNAEDTPAQGVFWTQFLLQFACDTCSIKQTFLVCWVLFGVWFLFLLFNFYFAMLCLLKIYPRHLSLAITSQAQFAKNFNTDLLEPATCQESFAMQVVKHYLTDWVKPSSISLWFLSW